jgi:hypothetical protein
MDTFFAQTNIVFLAACDTIALMDIGGLTYGTSCTGTYGWTLFGRNANLFRAADDKVAKRFLFKYNRSILILVY